MYASHPRVSLTINVLAKTSKFCVGGRRSCWAMAQLCETQTAVPSFVVSTSERSRSNGENQSR